MPFLSSAADNAAISTIIASVIGCCILRSASILKKNPSFPSTEGSVGSCSRLVQPKADPALAGPEDQTVKAAAAARQNKPLRTLVQNDTLMVAPANWMTRPPYGQGFQPWRAGLACLTPLPFPDI